MIILTLILCLTVLPSLAAEQDYKIESTRFQKNGDYVRGLKFTAEHQRYLKNNPVFAKRLSDCFEANLKAHQKFVEEVKIKFEEQIEELRRRGLAHEAELLSLEYDRIQLYEHPFLPIYQKSLVYSAMSYLPDQDFRRFYTHTLNDPPELNCMPKIHKEYMKLLKEYKNNNNKIVEIINSETKKYRKKSNFYFVISFYNVFVLETTFQTLR